MNNRLRPLVWSSSRGLELYQKVTMFHLPGHARRGECPGCSLTRKMEDQMSLSIPAKHK